MRINPRHGRGKRRVSRGFLLLEMLLAFGLFAMAATGFAIALHRTADLAAAAQKELKINRILESALAREMSQPVLEEGSKSEAVEEMSNEGMEIETTVELLPEMENEDGQLLQEMYHIEVVARWFESGVVQEQMAETWRYSRLYQP
jgi:Tfp pilus assembly protein PilV